jgi:photosystem II stability/assembly factor-like uncharacterized protein
MKKIFFLLLFFCAFQFTNAQRVLQLTKNGKTSLRGLSVANDNVIWASGNNGQVVKSIDGGKTFEWMTVAGYEQRDFRDIEAFDENTAVILAVDAPAIILKTKDGGKSWKEVFHDDTEGMFLDAMDFTQDGNGVVVGDPINGKLFIATSNNYGDKWVALKPEDNTYSASEGEAFFAASGSNVSITGNKYNPGIFFVTGGTKSRLFIYGQPLDLKIIQGRETQGANSVAVDPTLTRIAIVGGDFNSDTSSKNNIQLFTMKNTQLMNATVQTPPHGYRSSVIFADANHLVCCGTSGVDVSTDGGLNWRLISPDSYNVCAKSKNGTAIFLAGKNGSIAKLVN